MIPSIVPSRLTKLEIIFTKYVARRVDDSLTRGHHSPAVEKEATDVNFRWAYVSLTKKERERLLLL